MANPNTLGQFLRKERHLRELTMKEVAFDSGVNQGEICNIELGKRRCPTVPVLLKLSAYYDISPLELGEKIDLPSFYMELYLNQLRDKTS